MGRFKWVVIGLSLFVSACAGNFTTEYTTLDQIGFDGPVRVTDVDVVVPDGTSTTEANRLAPRADIVWHGELAGDRRAQTAAIVEEGILRGAEGSEGRGVELRVELTRFHAVTPSAVNLAPSAVHDIEFNVWIHDCTDGDELIGPLAFETDLLAFTRTQAAVAAAEGRTQRERIVHHISRVTQHWLGQSTDDPRTSFAGLGR